MKNYHQFHDGWFEGILIEPTCVRVFVRTCSDERYVLIANGVAALRASGFEEGNIIFDVLIRECDELTVTDIKTLYRFQPGESEDVRSQKLLEKSVEKGLMILEVNPSMGADCICLAQSISLETNRGV